MVQINLLWGDRLAALRTYQQRKQQRLSQPIEKETKILGNRRAMILLRTGGIEAIDYRLGAAESIP